MKDLRVYLTSTIYLNKIVKSVDVSIVLQSTRLKRPHSKHNVFFYNNNNNYYYHSFSEYLEFLVLFLFNLLLLNLLF